MQNQKTKPKLPEKKAPVAKKKKSGEDVNVDLQAASDTLNDIDAVLAEADKKKREDEEKALKKAQREAASRCGCW